MLEFDIKSDLPPTAVAVARMKNHLRYAKTSAKIVKIIHGYGSHGQGGGIRAAVRTELEAMKAARQIRAFIPGEAIGMPMGFDEDIRTYRSLLQGDPDYRKTNDGITFVIL